jgi:hypothetical protein
MKKTLDTLTTDKIEFLINSSDNYDKIRLTAVNFLSHKIRFKGISERCRIIWNRYYADCFMREYDIGNEKYFDFEKIDIELSNEMAIEYKKSFVKALEFLYNRNQLSETP